MAGGQSRRLGRDKALLEINGETLLARTLHVLLHVTAAQLIVGPPERAGLVAGIPVIPDEWPGSGPLGGIYSALRASEFAHVLVVACDMPFLNLKLLRYLLSIAGDYDVILPEIDGRGEQLHAIYARSCLEPIADQLRTRDFKIDRFFARVRVRRVSESELRALDPDLRSFWNVNTEEDWAEARAILADEAGRQRGG